MLHYNWREISEFHWKSSFKQWFYPFKHLVCIKLWHFSQFGLHHITKLFFKDKLASKRFPFTPAAAHSFWKKKSISYELPGYSNLHCKIQKILHARIHFFPNLTDLAENYLKKGLWFFDYINYMQGRFITKKITALIVFWS